MESTGFGKHSVGAARRLCLTLALVSLIWPMDASAAVKAGPGPGRGWQSVGPAPGSIAAAIAALAPSRTIYIGVSTVPPELLRTSSWT